MDKLLKQIFSLFGFGEEDMPQHTAQPAPALPETKDVSVSLTKTGHRVVNDISVNLIKSFEGLHRISNDGLVYAYHDMIGYPTIGIGHLLSRVRWEDLSKYKPITIEEAYRLKRADLDIFSAGVSRLITCDLTDNEFGALVSLSFNIGLGNLQASTLRRKLNRGDSKVDCAEEFLKWDKAGGRKISGLTRRRIAEKNLFLS